MLAASDPDAALWNQELAAYEGNTWLDLPWYLAESYFYRRLLEVVRYLEPGPWQGQDPFGLQKQKLSQATVAWLAANWGQFPGAAPDELFVAYLHSCLWGNRADLSNSTIREQAQGGLATRRERHNILIDHTKKVAGLLSAGVGRIDFINDNAGLELLFDLAFASFLLKQGWTRRVVFHLKSRPFFVSDAMPQDVRHLLALLPAEPLGERLARHLAAGALGLEDDPFWTSVPDVRPDAGAFARGTEFIRPGDSQRGRKLPAVAGRSPLAARYSAMEEVANYFPAPLLVLRTLKGEIMVGLAPGQAEALAEEDPTWLINGKRGIIQFVQQIHSESKERTMAEERTKLLSEAPWTEQRTGPGPAATDVGDPHVRRPGLRPAGAQHHQGRLTPLRRRGGRRRRRHLGPARRRSDHQHPPRPRALPRPGRSHRQDRRGQAGTL